MKRKKSKSTSFIEYQYLYTDDDWTGTVVDSFGWFAWLADGETFSFQTVTFRAELRRNGLSWYAFKWHDGRTHKRYAGRTPDMNLERLKAVVKSLPATIIN